LALPHRSETSSDWKALNQAIEHVQATRAAVKTFTSAEAVKGDNSLNDAVRSLKKRLKKAVRAADGPHRQCVIDEHQKRAGWRPIFELAMVRTVDLDQLTDMLTTVTRLLDPLALGPR